MVSKVYVYATLENENGAMKSMTQTTPDANQTPIVDNLYDAAVMLLRSWLASETASDRDTIVAHLCADTRAFLQDEEERARHAFDVSEIRSPTPDALREAATAILRRHDAKVQQFNFDTCGCDVCEELRPALASPASPDEAGKEFPLTEVAVDRDVIVTFP